MWQWNWVWILQIWLVAQDLVFKDKEPRKFVMFMFLLKIFLVNLYKEITLVVYPEKKNLNLSSISKPEKFCIGKKVKSKPKLKALGRSAHLYFLSV